MTLQEFFDLLGQTPSLVFGYFLIIPITALLAWILGNGEGQLTPWKYLYSVLVFLVCIPGIIAITLNIYFFLFEKQPIMSANLLTQILPIFSMILTLFLIRQNVLFDQIPGFGKISGLFTLIFIVLSFMWFIDRTSIHIFSYMPIQYLGLIFIGLFFAARWSTSKLFG